MTTDHAELAARLRAAVNEIMHHQFTHSRVAMHALQELVEAADDAPDAIAALVDQRDKAIAGMEAALRLAVDAQPTPPRAPLTDEQIMDLPAGVNYGTLSSMLRFARAVERAHGIGA